MFEFAIDGNPQGLEDAGRRMNVVVPLGSAGRRLLDGCDQVGNGPVSDVAAPGDNRPGDRTARRFFAVTLKEVGQLAFVERGEEIRSARSGSGIESHVEGRPGRAAALNAEAADWVGQLVGRQSEVEQHAIDAADSERIEDLGQIGIAGLLQRGAGVGEHVSGPREHRRIAIEADQFSVGSELFEDQPAVSAAADRAVNHEEPRGEIQKLEDLTDEDRTVDRRAGIAAGRRRIGHWLLRNELWETDD
jgi:hypothetical protein